MGKKLDAFCESTSLIGFRFLHSRHKFYFRFIWLVILVCSMGMMWYQIWDRVDQYWRNPTVTEKKEEKMESMLLPDLVICNAMQPTMSGTLFKNPSFSSPPYDLLNFFIKMRAGKSSYDTCLQHLKKLPGIIDQLRDLANGNNSEAELDELLDPIKAKLHDFPQALSFLEPMDKNCDKGWYFDPETLNCYFPDRKKRSWEEASEHCKKIGGNLASIHNDTENESLREITRILETNFEETRGESVAYYRPNNSDLPPYGTQLWWIGLREQLKWSDGTSIDYLRWNRPPTDQISDAQEIVKALKVERLRYPVENRTCALHRAADFLENITRTDSASSQAFSAQSPKEFVLNCYMGGNTCDFSAEVFGNSVCYRLTPKEGHRIVRLSESGLIALFDMGSNDAFPTYESRMADIYLLQPEIVHHVGSAAYKGYAGQTIRIEIDKAHALKRLEKNCGGKEFRNRKDYSQAKCQFDTQNEKASVACNCSTELTPETRIAVQAFHNKELVDQEPKSCVEEMDGVLCAHYGTKICWDQPYMGNHSHTIHDHECSVWNDSKVLEKYGNFGEEDHNFCRIPSRTAESILEPVETKRSAPWCFFQYRDKNWDRLYHEYCFPDCAEIPNSRSKQHKNSCGSINPKTNNHCSFLKQIKCMSNRGDSTQKGPQKFNNECPADCAEFSYEADITGGPLTDDLLRETLPEDWIERQSHQLEMFHRVHKHITPHNTRPLYNQILKPHREFRVFYEAVLKSLFYSRSGLLPCFENLGGMRDFMQILEFEDDSRNTRFIEEVRRGIELKTSPLLKSIFSTPIPALTKYFGESKEASQQPKLSAMEGELNSLKKSVSTVIGNCHYSLFHPICSQAQEQLATLEECFESRDAIKDPTACHIAVEFFANGGPNLRKLIDVWRVAKILVSGVNKRWKESWKLTRDFIWSHRGAFSGPFIPDEVLMARDYAPGSEQRSQLEELWNHFRTTSKRFTEFVHKYNQEYSVTNETKLSPLTAPRSIFNTAGREIEKLLSHMDATSVKILFPRLAEDIGKNMTEEVSFESVLRGLIEKTESCFKANEEIVGIFDKDYVFLDSAWMPNLTSLITDLRAFKPGFEYARRNYMLLQVYFRHMEIDSTTEMESYNLWQFLADAGGTGGLYMGATLITIVELAVFCAEAAGVRCAEEPASSEASESRDRELDTMEERKLLVSNSNGDNPDRKGLRRKSLIITEH